MTDIERVEFEKVLIQLESEFSKTPLGISIASEEPNMDKADLGEVDWISD